MQTTRSFPFPVLGNRDDVSGAFTPCLKVDQREGYYVLSFDAIAPGNTTLEELLADGHVRAVAQVSCIKTRFRKTFDLSEGLEVPIRGSNLVGTVAVDVSLVTAKAIDGYHPAGLHEDYGEDSFSLPAGAVVALAPRMTFFANKWFDPLRQPVSSFIKIRRDEERSHGAFRVETEDDKVYIVLPQTTFALYEHLKAYPPVIHAALVLPALMELLVSMSSGDAEGEWVERLRAIAEVRDIDLDAPLLAAQKLLGIPAQRAFESIDFALQEASNA